MNSLHQLARPILNAVTVLTLAIVVVLVPEVSNTVLLTIAAPAIGYTAVKGSGKKPE